VRTLQQSWPRLPSAKAMKADISLITSLYASEPHLNTFADAISSVFWDLVGRGVRPQLVVIANAPSPRERAAVARIRDAATQDGAGEVVVKEVGRESVYASWNRGVASASADYLGFWNVDDLRNSDALCEGLGLLRGNGAALVYFPWIEVRAAGGLLPRWHVWAAFSDAPAFSRNEFRRDMLTGPFFLFSRALYEQVGRFDEQFRIVGDFDWCVRATDHCDFVRGRRTGGIFVRHPGGLSSSGHPLHACENNVVFLRHGILDRVAPAPRSLMRKYSLEYPGVQVAADASTVARVFGSPGDEPEFDLAAWERAQRRRAALSMATAAPRGLLRRLGLRRAHVDALLRCGGARP